jgi:hypothetical protein
MADVVERADVGMIQAGDRASLALSPAQVRLVGKMGSSSSVFHGTDLASRIRDGLRTREGSISRWAIRLCGGVVQADF